VIKYVIESDTDVLINKEYLARTFPLRIEWFPNNDLILEPSGFQKIKITENLFILRKGIQKKGKTTIIPFLFLECVRRGDFIRARKYLSFDISDAQLREFFGEFELLINNYLEREDVFSILPKGAGEVKSFVFEIIDEKIANLSNL